MKIILNNKETEFDENTSIQDIANTFTVRGVPIPVYVHLNDEPVRNEDYKTTIVKEGDIVKVTKSAYGG